MKHTTLILMTLLAFANFAQAAEGNHLVILQSFQKPKALLGEEINTMLMPTGKTPSPEEYLNPMTNTIQALQNNGFSPYVIQTDDYSPLHKGLWALVLGPFDKATAKAKQQYVRTWVKDAYIKTVKSPIAQQKQQGFSTLNTRIDNAHCMVSDYSFKHSVGVNNLCQGLNQYSVYNSWGDQYNVVQITHKKQVWELFSVNQPGLVLDIKHPITWIYQNGKLLALSAVIDEPTETPRYAVFMGNTDLCPIDKRFNVSDIDAVLAYLNDNPNNCP